MQNAQNGKVLQNQPNLDLLMDQQMMEAQNHSSSSSSKDSGVVTSARTAAMIIPPFILKVCQKLPLDSVIPVWKEDIQKALVPARPVMDCILIKLWVALFGNKTQTGVVPGPVSIPTLVSKRPGSRTPLVDTMVRRSPRINHSAVNGFQMVKVREPATRRRKKLINLDEPPADVSEVINPIPLENIKEWGVIYGLSPEELTDDALMQGRTED